MRTLLSRRIRFHILGISFALLYAATEVLSARLVGLPLGAAYIVNLATGIGLIAFGVLGASAFGWILLSSLVVHAFALASITALSPPLIAIGAVGLAFISAIQAWLSWWFALWIERRLGRSLFAGALDVMSFAVIVCVLPALLVGWAKTVIFALLSTSVEGTIGYLVATVQRSLGDAIGVLLVGPLLWGWKRGTTSSLRDVRKRVLLNGLTLAPLFVSMVGSPHLVLLMIPLSIIASVFPYLRDAAATVTAGTLIALAMTGRGLGPFSASSPGRSFAYLAVFLIAFSGIRLTLSPLIAQLGLRPSFVLRSRGRDEPVIALEQRSSKLALVVLIAVILFTMVVGGVWFYMHDLEAARARQERDLQTVAQLKIDQLVAWRNERRGDARVTSQGEMIAASAAQLVLRPGDQAARTRLEAAFSVIEESYGYAAVLLVDRAGQVLASSDPALVELNPGARALAHRAIFIDDVVFGDIEQLAGVTMHFDVAAPVKSQDGQPIAVLILHMDPNDYVFPIIQAWPVASQTAETLLVRREGDRVLFLNILRYTAAAPLTLSIPLTSSELPAIQAVLGKIGFVEGKDYRGVPVLAYVAPVPDSPWFMVSKIDSSELRAEVAADGQALLLLVVMALLLSLGMISYVSGLRQRDVYQELFLVERERRQAQEEIRATLYGIADAVMATDPAGRITRMNPVTEQLTGWSEEEALGLTSESVFRIVREEDHSALESPVQLVLRAGKAIGMVDRTLLVARDGAGRPIAYSGAPIHGEGGRLTGVVIVFRDQAEERRRDAALRASEALFRRTFESAAVGMAIVGLDGRITKANAALSRLLGYSEEEMQGKTVPDVTHPDDVVRSMALVEALLRGERDDVRLEKRYLRKDGAAIWADVSRMLFRDEHGKPQYFVSHVVDITERRKAVDALRQSNEQLRELYRAGLALSGARSLPAIYATAQWHVSHLVDSPRFGITLFDEATSSLTPTYMMSDGMLLDETQFSPIVILPDSPKRGRASAIYTQIPTVVSDLRGPRAETSIQMRAPGDERLSESALYAPMIVNQRTIGLLEMQSYRKNAYGEADVSLVVPIANLVGLAIENARLIGELEQERNSLARRVKERTTELEIANRELEAFAYSVSHDLRAPLRAIDGFSAAIVEESGGRMDAPALAHFRRIQDASHRMAQLIDDLLKLSRVTRRELVLQPIDLTAVANGVADELRDAGPERDVRIEVAEGMTTVGDAHLMRIALQNLMANAWKFTGECGNARIEVGTVEQEGRQAFFVRDNGVGFDMAHAGKLFAPFSRLHGMTEFPGNGIGLATVQRIVTRHGGHVWCDAQPGAGATFFFTLHDSAQS